MRAGMYAEDQFCHIPISGGILDPTSASHCIRPLTRPPIHHWGNIMALDAKGRNREASERPVRTMASKTRRTILCDLYCRGTACKSRRVLVYRLLHSTASSIQNRVLARRGGCILHLACLQNSRSHIPCIDAASPFSPTLPQLTFIVHVVIDQPSVVSFLIVLRTPSLLSGPYHIPSASTACSFLDRRLCRSSNPFTVRLTTS